MKRRQTTFAKICLVAWCCVVTSLLFSLGEGMQLVPFSSSQFELPSSQVVGSSHEVTSFEHGPIHIPIQLRKRTKRDFNDFELPSTPAYGHAVAIINSDMKFTQTEDGPGFKGEFLGRAPPTC
jgi:hypothetical protein